ncbi:dihydrofolate synthase / folylpolyglutamate synthase [Marinitoga hydrogenitolerans DSM 16785]|uniref:Dihydrofolate synthase/folylpolyglutamate synthase n=1 Tax=Marinitoga hydrogenitolerans (strain DSM 16785 / JCM 12826 / AT1271) TaxID=1122195 RepID=A0A1M4TYW0_MARH1|nr:folylpolyglutamate synthase/dihydrofolate synthase family protein [Marinitoga hydrogenitolerans]SHE49553.1 dihydrofolate synthase / folylpolyglutamate synthase [Marinitoga hydrogenitolerans DSM 16785]
MISNLKDAVEYIYNRRGGTRIKYGLERINKLCELLGNPQKDFPVIHVTGTNGKGSTSRAIHDILKEHGLKVGIFTSPHLTHISERIRINGKSITNKDFIETLNDMVIPIEKMDSIKDEMSPSFFEIITALALKYFSHNKIDVAVLEVGLGGRLDATNVVLSDVSVITTVQYDHMNLLGNTLEEIAFEKAGIIKKDNNVVLGKINNSSKKVIFDRATEVGIKNFFEFDKNYNFSNPAFSLNWNSISYKSPFNEINDIIFKANGTYQPYNISTAIMAVESFFEKRDKKIDIEKTKKGLRKFTWEGRFELLEYNNKNVILEGAHNISGALALKNSIKTYIKNFKKAALVGILDDKDIESMLKIISNEFDYIIITQVPNKRSNNPELAYEILKKFNKNVVFIKNPIEAFERLLSVPYDYYFITGSLYLVGKIRGYMLNLEEI